jgi:hypothetical protein
MYDRYQYPKLIARGDSTAATGAVIYLLYYDAKTQELILRNLKIGTSTTSYAMGGNQYTNFNEADSNNSPTQLDAGRISAVPAGNGASRYFDMAVTSDNKVVIVYYDETAEKLKLRYSNTGVTGSPTTNPGWTASPVELPVNVGAYVSMDIDSANGLHIAAFDAGDSDLKYIYVPNYAVNANVKAVTVDQYGSVGSWTQIKLKDGVPYIAYYNAVETGNREPIKLAHLKGTFPGTPTEENLRGVDDNGYTTGNWEYMTVPAYTPPQGGSLKFKQVNLGFRTDGWPVLGYLGTKIEFSYPVGE